jgi:hypothetical protein
MPYVIATLRHETKNENVSSNVKNEKRQAHEGRSEEIAGQRGARTESKENMKVLNRTTGRFYIGFSPRAGQPIWSRPHRPSEATQLSEEEANHVVRQLTMIEPALDLSVVQ